MKKINKKVLNGVLGVGVLGVVLIGGAFAYLTDSDTADYAVKIGDVQVELSQVNKLDGSVYVVPNETLEVKPFIMNVGTNDAVVFMEVVMPIIDADHIVQLSGLAQADGSAKIVELFTIADDGNLNINNLYTGSSGDAYWEKVQVRVYGSDGKYMEGDVTVSGAATVGYVYGYNTKIAKGDVTEYLFTDIKAANFTEEYDENENTPVNIPVKVYAIQAEYVNGAASQAADASATITANPIDTAVAIAQGDLEKIFNTFVNQNNLNGIN